MVVKLVGGPPCIGYSSVIRGEVVIALISAQWVQSDWCRAELKAARLLSKKVIMALIGTSHTDVPADLAEEQWVDLASRLERRPCCEPCRQIFVCH
jgi:hypothetical protein